jgi:hypothetical protein
MNKTRGRTRKGNGATPAGASRKRPGPPVSKDKGLIRSLNRQFARTKKARPVEASAGHLPEPSACERCGAFFSRRLWRRGGKVTAERLAGVHWMICPACEQAREQLGFGRVLISGAFAAANEDLIRRRITNVAGRASFTQPERRLSSIERQGDILEVITTSQKLAHRIVRELVKLFRGRASYTWSDDGTLFATWLREK